MLFLVACGGGDDGALFSGGRYVETDVTPPIEGRFTSYLTDDGTIVCLSEGLKTRFDSADGGESWTEKPAPGRDTDRYQFVQSVALLPDGAMLVFLQDEGFVKIAPDGGKQPYAVDEIDKLIADGENVFVSLLQAFGDRLLMSYSSGGFAIQSTRPDGGSGAIGQRRIDGQSDAAAPGGRQDTQGAEPGEGDGESSGEMFVGRPIGEGDEPSGDMPVRRSFGTDDEPSGDMPVRRSFGTDDEPSGDMPVRRQIGEGEEPSGEMFVGRSVETGDEQSDEPSNEPSGEPDSAQRGQTQTYTNAAIGSSRGGPMRPITILCDLYSGRMVADLPVESLMAAASDDTNFYLLDSNSSVKSFNLNDGNPSGKPDVRFGGANAQPGFGVNRIGMGIMMMGSTGGNSLALGNEGELYSVEDGSLLLADSSGAISIVLESTAYSIGAPSSTVASVFVLGDGSIVINLISSGQVNHLYKYVWDENAKINPDKILSIWSLEENNFVRAAISELRKKHPDSYVTYEVALAEANAVSASDAIRTLNTQLLNGSGPDVILLDGCPVDSYANRGMLLDIRGSIDTDEMFGSLLDAYISNGKLFYLPAQFMAPVLMASEAYQAKANSLADLVRLVVEGNDLPAGGSQGQDPFAVVEEGDRATMYFNNLKELSNVLWTSSAPEIVKDNKLNIAALRQYLEAIKAVSDKYGLAEDSSSRGRAGMAMATFGRGGVTEIPGSLVWFTMQRTQYAAYQMSNLLLLNRMMEREGAVVKLFPGMTQGAWQPSTVVGISADTDVPDFAAVMVQTMLSVEVQQLNTGTGLPVTRPGIDAQLDQINELRREMGESDFVFDAGSLIDQLQAPAINDTVLVDMMWGSVEKCCRGEIDVEGAVKEIEQNIKNYLAERS